MWSRQWETAAQHQHRGDGGPGRRARRHPHPSAHTAGEPRAGGLPPTDEQRPAASAPSSRGRRRTGARAGKLAAGSFELAHELHERVHAVFGKSVVDRRAQAAERAVAFQALEAGRFGLR